MEVLSTLYDNKRKNWSCREELKLTRKELEKSAEAQKKSEVALNNQAKTLEKTAILNANSSLLDYFTRLSVNADLHENSRKGHRSTAHSIEIKIIKILRELESN